MIIREINETKRYLKVIFNRRNNKRRILGVIILTSLFITIPLFNNEEFFIRVSGYNLKEDNAVDADSNVDGIVNIGSSEGDYTNAQTQGDGVYQNLSEVNVGGTSVTEDFHGETGSSDNITDTNAPTDVGTYNPSGAVDNWNSTPDDTYTTLTEVSDQTENDDDHYDQEDSNVDSYNDVGVQSDPAYANDSVNSQYMNVQEADLGGVNSEWLNVNAWDQTYVSWTETGADPYLGAQDQPTNIIEGNNDVNEGWFDFPSTTLTGTLTVNISIYCNNDDGAGNDWADVYVDYTGLGGGADVGDVAQHTNWQYDNISLGSHSVAEVNNLRVYFGYGKSGGPDNVRIDHVRIGVSSTGTADYELDFEYQWTAADNDDNNEEVCFYIQTATQGGENLTAWEWDGSSWFLLGVLTADGWNNFTASNLTAATYTIKINDTDQADDSTQNNWNLDLITLHTWNTNYRFDREFSFNVEIDYTQTNRFLCLYTGLVPSEDLQVDIWNTTASSWDLITYVTMTNGWTNVSILDYMTSANITFRFIDTGTADDNQQNSWQVDASLVKFWPQIEWLQGWGHRKNATVTNATGAGINYQIKFIIHNSSGSDSGEHIYLGGNCRDDFGDVRFTTDDGSTLLDYWLEEVYEGDNATVWVEVTDNLDSINRTICIYYNNSNVETTSSVENTFTWGDTGAPNVYYIKNWDATWSRNYIPRITKTPNNRLFVVYQRVLDSEPQADNLYSHLYGSFSDDDGKTWETPFTIENGTPGTWGAHEPNLMVVNSTRMLFHYVKWYSLTNASLRQKTSTDNGETWENDVQIDTGYDYNVEANGGIKMQDGTLIWGISHCNDAGLDYYNASILRSVNDGEDWVLGGQVPNGTAGSLDEPAVVELSDNQLYMLMRTEEGSLFQSNSSDKGDTWETATSSGLVSSSAPATIKRVSWNPNKILVAWNNDSSSRIKLTMAISTDDCQTYDYAKVVNSYPDSPYDRRDTYPSITITASEKIAVAWWRSVTSGVQSENDSVVIALVSEDWLEVKWEGDYWSTTNRIDNGTFTVRGNAEDVRGALKSYFPTAVRMNARVTSDSVSDATFGTGDEPTVGYLYFPQNGTQYYTISSGTHNLYMREDGSWYLKETGVEATLSSYEVREFQLINDSMVKVFYDETEELTITSNVYNSSQTFWFQSRTGCDIEVDWVLIRNFIYPEPGYGEWTSEETSTITYQLEWEHQTISIDTDKDSYNVTVYGYSSGGDSEDFEIRMWNATSTAWSGGLGNISTTEQWYNYSFSKNYLTSGIVTWQYRDTNRTEQDTTETTLRIDYAGITTWNFTVDLLEASIDNADYKQDSGWELFDGTPFTINVTSGITYDVEIKGVDGSGSPVTNEYLRFNTVNNPNTGTNLSTSYQTLYSSQSPGDQNQHTFYFWCAVPFGVDDQTMTFTLYIRIVKT